MYPKDTRSTTGKLRLLYECAPLAFIAEQAGGLGSTGEENILDMVPKDIHERVPLFIGNKYDVEVAQDFLSGKRTK
jgi:fructose-1,6-bisphosphatase I